MHRPGCRTGGGSPPLIAENEISTTGNTAARTLDRAERAGRLREWLYGAVRRLTAVEFQTFCQKVHSLHAAGLRPDALGTSLREIADLLVRACACQNSQQLTAWMLGFEDSLPAAGQRQWREAVGSAWAAHVQAEPRELHDTPIQLHCISSVKSSTVKQQQARQSSTRSHVASEVVAGQPFTNEAQTADLMERAEKVAAPTIGGEILQRTAASQTSANDVQCFAPTLEQKEPSNMQLTKMKAAAANSAGPADSKQSKELHVSLATGPLSKRACTSSEDRSYNMGLTTAMDTTNAAGCRFGVAQSIEVSTVEEKEETKIPALLKDQQWRKKLRQGQDCRLAEERPNSEASCGVIDTASVEQTHEFEQQSARTQPPIRGAMDTTRRRCPASRPAQVVPAQPKAFVAATHSSAWAKRPASEICVPEAEHQYPTGGVEASNRRVCKKRPAAIDDTRKGNDPGAGSACFSEETILKVLRPPHLGLKIKVGKSYTVGDLLERCKGQTSKIARLTQLTKDVTFFEQVDNCGKRRLHSIDLDENLGALLAPADSKSEKEIEPLGEHGQGKGRGRGQARGRGRGQGNSRGRGGKCLRGRGSTENSEDENNLCSSSDNGNSSSSD